MLLILVQSRINWMGSIEAISSSTLESAYLLLLQPNAKYERNSVPLFIVHSEFTQWKFCTIFEAEGVTERRREKQVKPNRRQQQRWGYFQHNIQCCVQSSFTCRRKRTWIRSVRYRQSRVQSSFVRSWELYWFRVFITTAEVCLIPRWTDYYSWLNSVCYPPERNRGVVKYYKSRYNR